MNTKGSSILMMIFEILVVALTIYLTTSIAAAYTSSTLTTKITMAEEMRMMMDTLVGVPGDAMAMYPHKVSAYSFILTKGSISVFGVGEAHNLWVAREFILPQGYTAEGSVESVDAICLEKRGIKIVLRGCI